MAQFFFKYWLSVKGVSGMLAHWQNVMASEWFDDVLAQWQDL
jgi:hypothetical protein